MKSILFILDLCLSIFIIRVYIEYKKSIIFNFLYNNNLNHLPKIYKKSISFHKSILKTKLNKKKITEHDLMEFYVCLMHVDIENYKCVPKKYKNSNQILKMKIIKS